MGGLTNNQLECSGITAQCKAEKEMLRGRGKASLFWVQHAKGPWQRFLRVLAMDSWCIFGFFAPCVPKNDSKISCNQSWLWLVGWIEASENTGSGLVKDVGVYFWRIWRHFAPFGLFEISGPLIPRLTWGLDTGGSIGALGAGPPLLCGQNVICLRESSHLSEVLIFSHALPLQRGGLWCHSVVAA